MQLTKRQWSLSVAQRLLILACAGLYLVVFRPWMRPEPDGANSVYAGATAMIVLALLPSKLRLLAAVGLAIASAFVVLVGLRVLGTQA